VINYDPDRVVPNWAPGAAEYLSTLIRNDDTCFEWGGGQSTPWLADLCPYGSVVTVEHDLEWLRRIVDLTRDHTNCQIIWAPCENVGPGEAPDWMMRYVNAVEIVRDPDVWLIDGYLRPECLEKAKRLAMSGNIIVLDDALDYVGDQKRPHSPWGQVFQMPHPNKGERNLWGKMSPNLKETWVYKV
jgi:hypothetical protein